MALRKEHLETGVGWRFLLIGPPRDTLIPRFSLYFSLFLGNYRQRRVGSRLAPPPTSLDKRETFSVSRRLSRCSTRLARMYFPCLSLTKATSRVLGGVSLSGPVAVPFDLCQMDCEFK
jgi:hypothetical protein